MSLEADTRLMNSFFEDRHQGQGCFQGTHLLDGLKGRGRVHDVGASNAIVSRKQSNRRGLKQLATFQWPIRIVEDDADDGV